MRIVIVGPGAIGCLFAGLLARAGRNIALLDKDPDRAAHIAGQGLQIESGAVTHTVHVDISADPAHIPGPVDCLCICVKAYDTGAAMAHARPLVSGSTLVVSFQNGLGNLETVISETAGGNVACAVTSYGSTALAAGHVRHAGTGPTAVAPAGDCSVHALREFADALRCSGFEVAERADHRSMLWSKAVVNAAINPLTAINDVNNGTILQRTDLRDTAMACAEETARVARAAGIDLLFDSPEAEVEAVCKRTAGNLSSMLQDVRAGRKTEIEAITGTIVKKARELNVPVPVNEMLLAQVKSLRTR